MNFKIQLKAEDHIYFTNRPDAKSSTFEELGIMPFANAPEPFLPDLTKLCSNVSMLDMAKLVSTFNASQIRILQYLLTQVADLQEEGLKFGQLAYYRVATTPNIYISDFIKVRPIAIKKIKGTTFIVCCSSLDNVNGTCLLIERNSLLTRSEFKKVFRDLLALGQANSPTPLWHTQIRKIEDVPEVDIVKTVKMTPKLKQELRKPRRKGNFTIKMNAVN
jgi:hypothetical protein